MKARWAALLAAFLAGACGQASAPGAIPSTPTAIVLPAVTLPPALTAPPATAAASLPSATALTLNQSPTPFPAATATAVPAARQLTQGGCCVQPFWSADSRQVRYIDRPSSGQPSGIWAVSAQGGAPTFVTARLGIYSPDETLVAYPERGQTYIERVGGQRWKISNGGRAVLFSPDSQQIAWQVASSTVNFDSRQVQIWVAAVDGSSARQVADLVGGGLSAWFPDGRRLLVTARSNAMSQIEALDLADGRQEVIASAARIQGLTLSPSGGWVAYSVTFSGDPNQDGLYAAPTSGTAASKLDTFGAFTWRSEGRLLIIPLEPDAASNRLLEYDVAASRQRPLTDPGVTPIHIAGGNWALSPDGQQLAFVSAADHNLWVLDLPE